MDVLLSSATITSERIKTMEKKAVRNDAGKPRWDLLPYDALAEVVNVLTYGAVDYGDDNWLQGGGFNYQRVFGSTMRHLTDWVQGSDLDRKTKMPELAHAACNVLFLLTYQLRSMGIDDRTKTFKALKQLPEFNSECKIIGDTEFDELGKLIDKSIKLKAAGTLSEPIWPESADDKIYGIYDSPLERFEK